MTFRCSCFWERPLSGVLIGDHQKSICAAANGRNNYVGGRQILLLALQSRNIHASKTASDAGIKPAKVRRTTAGSVTKPKRIFFFWIFILKFQFFISRIYRLSLTSLSRSPLKLTLSLSRLSPKLALSRGSSP